MEEEFPECPLEKLDIKIVVYYDREIVNVPFPKIYNFVNGEASLDHFEKGH